MIGRLERMLGGKRNEKGDGYPARISAAVFRHRGYPATGDACEKEIGVVRSVFSRLRVAQVQQREEVRRTARSKDLMMDGFGYAITKSGLAL